MRYLKSLSSTFTQGYPKMYGYPTIGRTFPRGRDTGAVRAQSDLIKLSGRAVGVFHRERSVSDIWIRHDLAFGILTVEEP